MTAVCFEGEETTQETEDDTEDFDMAHAILELTKRFGCMNSRAKEVCLRAIHWGIGRA